MRTPIIPRIEAERTRRESEREYFERVARDNRRRRRQQRRERILDRITGRRSARRSS